MPPRRIAYFDHTAVLSGGELALFNLVAAVDRGRWAPEVILGASGPLVERLRSAGLPTTVIPLAARLVRHEQMETRRVLDPLKTMSAATYAVRLSRKLRKSRVRLLHANSLRACVLGSIAARLAGIPSIWQIHSVVAPPMIAPAGTRLLRALARRLPAHVIFNSNATATCFDLPSQRRSVIPCGVDASRFAANGHAPSGHLRVGMVARIAPLKGQHIFLEAVSQVAERHPEAEFVIAGTPLFGEEGYADQIRAQAARSGARDRIQFLGFVDDVPALLHDLDVVVHASVQPEGFGQVIVEAMMAGKPVIASALGGSVDLVVDHVTGRLVPPADPQTLAETLEAMIGDPAAAAAMGRQGRERALQLYDIRRTAAAVQDVYERVLAA